MRIAQALLGLLTISIIPILFPLRVAANYSYQETESEFYRILTSNTEGTKQLRIEKQSAWERYVQCTRETLDAMEYQLEYIQATWDLHRRAYNEMRDLYQQSHMHAHAWEKKIIELFEIKLDRDVQRFQVLDRGLEGNCLGQMNCEQIQEKLIRTTKTGDEKVIDRIQEILEIAHLPNRIAQWLKREKESNQKQVKTLVVTGNKSLVEQCKDWAKNYQRSILATVCGAILMGACTIASDFTSAATQRQQLTAALAANQNSAMANQLTKATMINNQVLSSDGTMIQMPGAPPIPFASLSGLAPQGPPDWKATMNAPLKNRKLKAGERRV